MPDVHKVSGPLIILQRYAFIIDDILYTKGLRWCGMLTDGTMAEFDVVAESLDRKHLLIGECKWTKKENTEALGKRATD